MSVIQPFRRKKRLKSLDEFGRKPFRSTPVVLGPVYAARARERRRIRSVVLFIGGTLAGILIGLAILAFSRGGWTGLKKAAHELAIATSLERARGPQAGDHWSSCHRARKAGTAPIFVTEPGYRKELDADGDGIACEPVLFWP